MNKSLALKSLYDSMLARLSKQHPQSAVQDVRHILQKRAGIDWAAIISDPFQGISPVLVSQIEEDMAALLAGAPLSRIYGAREFYGLEFTLNADTLDPRPETELLVDLSQERLKSIENPRILDLGTGSGCVLISLLHHIKDAQGVGIDLSDGALKVAKQNAQNHNVAERAQFICGNWAESLDSAFDLVVSNPPYIENQVIETLEDRVKNHDPILALAGGNDGLQAYREIFLYIPRLLKTGGVALFEIGFDQRDSIMRLSEESRFILKAVHCDLGGQPRVAEIFLP